jgi:hypothetical protein
MVAIRQPAVGTSVVWYIVGNFDLSTVTWNTNRKLII